jgi:hypothetical protein
VGVENCFGVDPAFNAAPNCDPKAITCIKVASTGSATQPSVPVTFGQPFKAGDLPQGTQLSAKDGNGQVVAMQMDDISSHLDGSVRFAVLSAQISNLAPGEKRVVNLFKATSAATSATNYSTSTYDLKLAATVYTPQITQVTFGNRNGGTPGVPFNAGETITLQLGDSPAEIFTHTVTPDQAGGGFATLSQIAIALQKLINTSSKNFFAYEVGTGGGYENLWISSKANFAAPFTVTFTYAGLAKHTIKQLQTYTPARHFEAKPGAVLDAQISANQSPRLNGAVAREYTLVAPFTEVGTGIRHPQLVARLHTRFVDAGQRVRTDMVIENNWTYEPAPGNLTYDLTVTQGSQTLFNKEPFIHNHHARWHKVLWTGDAPQAQVRHNMRYFLDSRATWNYDLTLAVPESVLAAEATNLAKADTSPMGPAFITTYFPNTGGRQDIGPLPRWTALYLVTQDARARASMFANADAAAGIPIHYRDLATDQPVSLETHPGLALGFGTSSASDALPTVTNGNTVWVPDTSHQASFAYLPYLITGDTFYLDELLFWANWNMGSANPSYREGSKGLIKPEQIRGQAWALRSIGESARALADKHPMKGYFQRRLADNLNWYVTQYPQNKDNTKVSSLGFIEKPDEVGQTAPWQNDFMALVTGQIAESGDPLAAEYFNWISRFTVGRFLNEPYGFCRAQAAAYYITIRKTNGTFIESWNELYKANWPNIKACDLSNPVDGYPNWSGGYAAYARAMLGNASSLGINGARDAFTYWKSVTPGMSIDFLNDPTWAIVPRVD